MKPSSLVVGIGSPNGDDRVGWEVADRLSAIAEHTVAVRCARTPADLLDWLEGIERLEICDAVSSNSIVGSVACWQWPSAQIEQAGFHTSHDLSLPAALSPADALGHLPARVRIWGVTVEPGGSLESLSPAAAAAVPIVVRRICDALDEK